MLCERWRGRSWARGEAGTLGHSLSHSLTHSLSTENVGAGVVCCQFTFQTLHATSQVGSSLEFVAATACRECYIQDARARGLWAWSSYTAKTTEGHGMSTAAHQDHTRRLQPVPEAAQQQRIGDSAAASRPSSEAMAWATTQRSSRC